MMTDNIGPEPLSEQLDRFSRGLMEQILSVSRRLDWVASHVSNLPQPRTTRVDPFASRSVEDRLSVLEALVRDHGVAIETGMYPQAPATDEGETR